MGRSCVNSLSSAFFSDSGGNVLPRETQELVFEHVEGKSILGNDFTHEGRAGQMHSEGPYLLDILPFSGLHALN